MTIAGTEAAVTMMKTGMTRNATGETGTGAERPVVTGIGSSAPVRTAVSGSGGTVATGRSRRRTAVGKMMAETTEIVTGGRQGYPHDTHMERDLRSQPPLMEASGSGYRRHPYGHERGKSPLADAPSFSPSRASSQGTSKASLSQPVQPSACKINKLWLVL